MTTKHSLFTRGLSLVLALVLVLGNLTGFAMEAKAAEGNLFKLIADNKTASNKDLNTILQNANAIPELAALNVNVAIDEAPEEVIGHFYQGALNVKSIGNWEPAYYSVEGEKSAFDGIATVEDVAFVGITYKQNLNASDKVQAVYDYIASIGAKVEAQKQLLNAVSTLKSLQALEIMDGGFEDTNGFVEDMLDAVTDLQLSDVNIELPTVEEIREEINLEDVIEVDYEVDVNGDGVIDQADKDQIIEEKLADPEVQAKIDAKIEEKLAEAEAEVEAEFAETKAEYLEIVKQMYNNLLLDVDNEYYLSEEYLHSKYHYPIYENKLRIYAMLAEYDTDGLAHYFAHAEDIIAELKSMSSVLKDILGELQEDGTYENAEIVQAMLDKMGYGADVTIDHLVEMSTRMADAAKKLPEYTAIIKKIDLSAADAVNALFFAKNQEDLTLVGKFSAAGLNPEIYAESDELLMYAQDELAHDIVHVNAVEPGCHYTGNTEYWYCSTCDLVCLDEAMTQVTNRKNVIVPEKGSSLLVAMDAVEPGCHDNGCVAYWICYECNQVWTDEARTQLSNIKNVTVPALGGDLVHVEAVAPTATENGNIEHWYCNDCGKVWADEALTQVTNHLSVILPATGEPEAECFHEGVLHFDAVEPACHYNGNVEYWFCPDCEGYWQDAALTRLTNSKRIIAPALGGEVAHVEAVAPTATENGNIEHWYCETCEQVWQDEALTQVTNRLNVILPATGEEIPGSSAENPITVNFEMNEAWSEGDATISVAPGTWYYAAYLNGMILTANGEVVEVASAMPRMPSIFSFTNEGTEPVTYELHVSYPLGNKSNPAPLAMGENTAEIAANAGTGYFYSWTAPSNGVLVLTMPEGDWSYVVNNYGTSEDYSDDRYGDIQWSDSDPVVNPSMTKVAKGEKLEIMVSTYDPANPFGAPAGTLVFKAELKTSVNVSFAPVGGSIVSSAKYDFGHVLTEEDVLKHLEAINKAAAKKYAHVDEEAFLAAYVGYELLENSKFEYELLPNSYAVTIDGVSVEVPVNSEDGVYYITLADAGYEAGIVYTIEIDGQEILVTDVEQQIPVDVEKMAAGGLVIKTLPKALESLVAQLNEMATGDAHYEVVDGALVANLTLGQLADFGYGIVDAVFDRNGDGTEDESAYIDVELNGLPFLSQSGALTINLPTVINAMLCDEEFTSENLTKIGEDGHGEILHATMKTPVFKAPFVLNLTSAPAKMGTVAKALKKLAPVMTFEAHEGHLNIDLEIPEKVYEAYLAVALVTGQIDKTNTAALNNTIALTFLQDYIEVIQKDTGVNAETYNNTLAMLGIDKSLQGKYAEACDLIHGFIQNAEKFEITVGEKTSDLVINATNADIDSFLALYGTNGTSMSELVDGKIDFVDEPIDTLSYINIINTVPNFDAAIIDPTRVVNKNFGVQDIKDKNFSNIINSETTKSEKAMFANLTTNLPAQLADVYGASAIMLLNDVKGDLTFDHITILDLNGHSVNGSIKANAPVVILDSSINTVSGATVTGSVSGNVTILGGTYAAKVSDYLPDGYYQASDKAVKHALYEIKGNKLLVDPRIYVENVDGYLPAVHYLASQIAVDFALNYYTAAALYTDGKTTDSATNKVYDINFEDLVGLLSSKSIGLVADQILACINTEDLSDFANKILADLVNVDKIANGLKTGEVISTYHFAIHPWQLNLEHIEDGNYLTVGVVANEELAKTATLPLSMQINTDRDITIPCIDKEISIQDILDELSRVVVTVDDDAVNGTNVEIMVNQPVRNGKTLVVGGSANATFNLNFAHNTHYNRILGAALAYFDEDLTKDLVKNGCIVDLNEAMHDITVGQLFDTINKVVQNKEIPFEKIAAKLELELTDSQLAKLTKAYDMFQNGVAKVMAKFDLADIAATPLSDLVDNDGRLVFDADLQPHYADAFYKGFGIAAEVDYSKVKVILTFANDHQPGEPVREDICNCSYDLVTYCELCGIELSREHVRGLWGDVNCDNLVDARDAAWIAKYEVGLATAEDMVHFDRADVNCDGIVDARDSAWIAKCEVGIVNYEDFPAVKAENA